MAIDTLPETHGQTQSRRAEPTNDPRQLSLWWKRGLLALVMVTCLASAAALISTAITSEDTGPRLTHTIARGDLVVTVTEQGILESSENTEIKCKVRGYNAVLWIIESGTVVEAGDELVRLDSAFIQEQIDERTKYAHWSQSAADHSAAQMARAKLAVSEYEQGRYVADLLKLEKDLVIAEAALRAAENALSHAQLMWKSDYKSELEVEEKDFAVKQARLEVDLKRTQLDVLKEYTKKEESQTLKGNLTAVTATHGANAERAMADASRRDRALEEVQHCTIKADRSGLVIHPNAAKWESAPIAEGTNVYKDQVLLLMPDLSKMQVKVGIHESVIDRVTVGLSANVTLPDKSLKGTVSSVASVTKPAGWWTGNEVKYDTLVELPAAGGLRPGMSAEVEVVIAQYEDVLMIPVAATVEIEESHYCWVRTPQGDQRRPLVLGDSNDVFTIVEEGLQEGDEVILNPLAFGDVRLATTTSPDKAKTSVPESNSK